MIFKVSQTAINNYILRRESDLLSLKESLSSQNFSHILEIAHQIKGSAATFGFEDLGQRAEHLEAHALEKNMQGLQEDIFWIEKWLQEKLPIPT